MQKEFPPILLCCSWYFEKCRDFIIIGVASQYNM